MRPLTWALKEVDPVDYQLYHYYLESLRNRTPSNLKLHHTSKNSYLWQEDVPWSTGPVLKHNGKSGTDPVPNSRIKYTSPNIQNKISKLPVKWNVTKL